MIKATTYTYDGKPLFSFQGQTRRQVLRKIRETYEPEPFIGWLISCLRNGTDGGIVFSTKRKSVTHEEKNDD